MASAARAALVAALDATDRKDALAWLRLLRHDYAAAKAAATPAAWAALAAAYRGPALLPTDQRRSEAFALIQIDEARIKIHLGAADTRTFLKATRTIPQGRSNWALWRASVIYEAQQGDAAAARRLLTECRSRFSGTEPEFLSLDRLLKDGGVAAVARLSIDDDVVATGTTAAAAGFTPYASTGGISVGGAAAAVAAAAAVESPDGGGGAVAPTVDGSGAVPIAAHPTAAAAANSDLVPAAVTVVAAADTAVAPPTAADAPAVPPALSLRKPPLQALRAAATAPPLRVPRNHGDGAAAAAATPTAVDTLSQFAAAASCAPQEPTAPALAAAVAVARGGAAARELAAAAPPPAEHPAPPPLALSLGVRRRVGGSLASRPSTLFFSALSPVAEGATSRAGGGGAGDVSTSTAPSEGGGSSRASARSSTASAATSGGNSSGSAPSAGAGGRRPAAVAGGPRVSDAMLLDDEAHTAATAAALASDPTVTVGVATARGAFSVAAAAPPPAAAHGAVAPAGLGVGNQAAAELPPRATAAPAAAVTAALLPQRTSAAPQPAAFAAAAAAPTAAAVVTAAAAASARVRFDVPEYIRSFDPRSAVPARRVGGGAAAATSAASAAAEVAPDDASHAVATAAAAAAARKRAREDDQPPPPPPAPGEFRVPSPKQPRRAASAAVARGTAAAAGPAVDDRLLHVAADDGDERRARQPQLQQRRVAAPTSQPPPPPPPQQPRLDESTEEEGGPRATDVSVAHPLPGAAGGGSDGPFDNLTCKFEVARVAGRDYLRLDCVGRGGSSRVYRVLGDDMKVYALKRVRLARMDASSLASYLNEIALLRRLNSNPAAAAHIIRLIDAEVSYETRCVNMVMEYGQCDLSSLLAREKEKAQQQQQQQAARVDAGHDRNAGLLDDNFLRLIWQQMLQAVQTIHDARIVHGDLKPANFVFVEGVLKLIDFGIAKAISNDTTNIVRDAQIGTLNYMSPEAILDVSGGAPAAGRGGTAPLLKIGRASDIWSLGCILYQMVWGRTPFAELSLMQKLHAIVSTSAPVAVPPLGDADLGDVIAACLRRDPAARPPIGGPDGLLAHPFLRPRRAAAAAGATAAAGVAALLRHLPPQPPGLPAAVQAGPAAVDALYAGAAPSHPPRWQPAPPLPQAELAAGASALRALPAAIGNARPPPAIAASGASKGSLESVLRDGLARVAAHAPIVPAAADDDMNTSFGL